MTLNPLTVRKINRFKEIKRGYWSFLILVTLLLFSFVAELFINSKALIVGYQGNTYFPVVSDIYIGKDFGLNYSAEVNYRDLKKHFEAEENSDNYVVMPLVPWNAYEQDFNGVHYPPVAPDSATQHYLGTDIIGRDVLARLVYGFRTAVGFALMTMVLSYIIGISMGCAMGFFGGKFDLLSQRLIEIWSMVPFLYVIMILVSVVQPTFGLFVLINVVFSWMGITWYMRTMTYKKLRENTYNRQKH